MPARERRGYLYDRRVSDVERRAEVRRSRPSGAAPPLSPAKTSLPCADCGSGHAQLCGLTAGPEQFTGRYICPVCGAEQRLLL